MFESIPSILNIAAQSGAADAGAAAGVMAAMFGFMGVFWAFYCVLLLISLVIFVLWLWMLIDCLKHEDFPNENDKVLWAIIMLLGGWIGALLYYILVKRKMDPASAQAPQEPAPLASESKGAKKRKSAVV